MPKLNRHLLDLVRWDTLYADGNHNAFTSLTWFRDQPYVAFRQGGSHGSWDGRDLVLRGTRDGRRWRMMAALPPARSDADARDPKLLATPEGLFCYLPVRWQEGGRTRLSTERCFSVDGERWTAAEEMLPGWFLFWARWHQGRAYAAAYDAGERQVMFFHSADGHRWQELSILAAAPGPGGVNETAFDFAPDGTCWAIVRNDVGDCHPLLVHAHPPYTRWEARQLSISMKTNCLWFVKDQIYISGRWYPTADFRAMAVFRVQQSGDADLALLLPGGGDLSYMSAAPHPDDPLRFWLTYYSSHRHMGALSADEGQDQDQDEGSDIFFSEVRFLEEEGEWPVG